MSTNVIVEVSEFNVITEGAQGPRGSTAQEFWTVRDQIALSEQNAKASEDLAKESELAAKASEESAKVSEIASSESAAIAANASRLQIGTVSTEESGIATAEITGPAGTQILSLGLPRGPTGAGGTIGCYLSAVDTSNQPILVANTPQRLNISTLTESVRISLESPGRVVFYEAGVYSLTFSVQFTNLENNVINRASVWLNYNGQFYPNSASYFDIPAFHNNKSGELVGTVNFVVTAPAADDWVELWWTASSTQVSASTIISESIPSSPSVILTVTQVMYTQTADVTPQLEALRQDTVQSKTRAVQAEQAAKASETSALESKDAAEVSMQQAFSHAQIATQQADKATIEANLAATEATTSVQASQVSVDAKSSVLALLHAFQGVFLGSFSSDLEAQAFATANSITIQDGTLYQNTLSDKFRVYTGTVWQDYDSSAQQLQSAAQLSAVSAATSAEAALQSKLSAQLSAQTTAADVVQTNLDVQATTANRLQTGLDTQSTAADRAQTGLDRAQTRLDAQATSADRVQTGLDVAATLDNKNSSNIAAAASLTYSQNSAQSSLQSGVFADNSEVSARHSAESAASALASKQSIDAAIAGPNVNALLAISPSIVAVGNDLPNINTVATNIISINTVASGIIPVRTVVIPDGTSITFNVSTTDIAQHTNTQATGILTVNAPTGTPYNFQRVILYISSVNTQTYNWNSIFAGSTDLPLPSATIAGKAEYLSFVYNNLTSKWNLIAKLSGF